MKLSKNIPVDKDPVLRTLAKKRIEFKRHLVSYLTVNVCLRVLWGLTDSGRESTPWPAFVTFFRGIGVASHFSKVYFFPGEDAIEQEYQRIQKSKKTSHTTES